MREPQDDQFAHPQGKTWGCRESRRPFVGFTRTERTVLYAGLALMLNALDVDLDESDRLELPTVSR